MKNAPQSILIVDDHALFREGLRELIEHWDDFQVMGEAENGQEAVDLCRKQAPDVILMDIHMPRMNGVEAAQRIHPEFPLTHIVMLTMAADDQDLFEAIKAGAQGYVLKNVRAQQLHDLLRGVVRGEAPLDGAMAAKVLAEFGRMKQLAPESLPPQGKLEALTDREIRLLQYLVDGLSNAEIGEKLYLSEQTIKKELSSVMQKLHLNNRVQVAAYALRTRLAK